MQEKAEQYVVSVFHFSEGNCGNSPRVTFQDLDELFQDTGPPYLLVTDRGQLPVAWCPNSELSL